MTRNDTRIIHTDGLEEGIRCAMCTNPMANNRGCDGGCDINESMYKRVLDVIKKNILEQEQCEDAVSRQAVKEQMIYYGFHAPDMTVTEFVEDCLSPVNPQESKTGHWIEHNTPNTCYYDCSLCGCVAPCTEFADSYLWKLSNFCPNCGAKMVESQERSDKE